MYGLVNKALEQLLITEFGEEAWENILDSSGVEVDMFFSMDNYDDSITYDLVAAASKILDRPAEEILSSFGEYWIISTGEEQYRDIMKMSGDTLPEFLSNLNNMHMRVALLHPDLRLPTFNTADITDEGLTVHYHSDREGLAPFVYGLLRGLGEKFNVKLKIEQTAHKMNGADHDIFALKYVTDEVEAEPA